MADGSDVGENSREGKILTEVIQLLDDMHAEIRALDARVEETEEYVDAIDEDLEDLELLLYDDDENLYELVDDDCDDGDEDDNQYLQYYDLDDDDEAYTFQASGDKSDEFETSYEFECPSCHEMIFLHEEIDDEGYHHYVIEQIDSDAQPINPT